MRWQPDRFVRLTRIGSTWNVLASSLSWEKHTALRATEMGLVPLLDKVAGACRLAVPAPDLNVYTTRISNVSELDVPNPPVDDMVTV